MTLTPSICFIMVPKEEVVELKMSVDEGLRMIISMGSVVPHPKGQEPCREGAPLVQEL